MVLQTVVQLLIFNERQMRGGFVGLSGITFSDHFSVRLGTFVVNLEPHDISLHESTLSIKLNWPRDDNHVLLLSQKIFSKIQIILC